MRRGPNILSIRHPSQIAHNIDIGGTGGCHMLRLGSQYFVHQLYWARGRLVLQSYNTRAYDRPLKTAREGGG